MCTFHHLHTVVFENCCLVVFPRHLFLFGFLQKIDLEVSHSPSSHILGMIPFQWFFWGIICHQQTKKVLCNSAMGIPINGIPWIPIEVTLLFLAGEGPLHSVPLGGYGCVSSHSSHLFLDSETLKTWLKTCTRQVVYPIDLQRVIIFQQSRISVYEKNMYNIIFYGILFLVQGDQNTRSHKKDVSKRSGYLILQQAILLCMS